MKERCCNCRHWSGSPDTNIGKCRRYPPICNGKFPLVMSNDWCGEFTPIVPMSESQVHCAQPPCSTYMECAKADRCLVAARGGERCQ